MGGLGQGVAVQPRRPAELIPLLRFGRFPRGIDWNRFAHLSQLEEDRADVGDGPRAHRQRNRALVAVLLAVDEHHRVAVDELLVAGHAELVHESVDGVLARADPGATAIDPRPVVASLGEGATADAITGLEQRHRVARLFQSQSGGQSGESRTYHAIVHVGHELSPLLSLARAAPGGPGEMADAPPRTGARYLLANRRTRNMCTSQ